MKIQGDLKKYLRRNSYSHSVMCQECKKMYLNKYRLLQWMVKNKQLFKWPIIVTMRFNMVLLFVLIYKTKKDTTEKTGRCIWIQFSTFFVNMVKEKNKLNSCIALMTSEHLLFFNYCNCFSCPFFFKKPCKITNASL